MTTYRYPKIDSSQSQIKLLTLLAGENGDPLRIKLELHRLEEGMGPGKGDLEAVSYVWGPATSFTTVTEVLSLDLEDQILGYENLQALLRGLRLEDSNRTLWIDALCIDQNNTVERSEQVQLMVRIYSSAERVICWLGPEADDSSLALETLDVLARKIEVD
jgi:hypothetical protein